MSPIRREQRNLYPSDWPAISRRIRFERAGGRCECRGECGVAHDFIIEADLGRCTRRHREVLAHGTRVVLTTAHLDHDPRNCADDNLRAYCQACHLRYDRALHATNAARTRDRKRGQLRFAEVCHG